MQLEENEADAIMEDQIQAEAAPPMRHRKSHHEQDGPAEGEGKTLKEHGQPRKRSSHE